jgi:hypothetical protein
VGDCGECRRRHVIDPLLYLASPCCSEVHVTRIKFHIFLHFGDQRFLDGISVSPELEFRMPGSFYAFRMKSKEIRYYYFFFNVNLLTIPSNFKTVIQFTDFVDSCLDRSTSCTDHSGAARSCRIHIPGTDVFEKVGRTYDVECAKLSALPSYSYLRLCTV